MNEELWYKVIFWGIWIISGVIMLISYGRSKKPIKAALKGMLSGGIALTACYIMGGVVYLPLHLLNLVVALILGVPGVLLLQLGKLAIGS